MVSGCAKINQTEHYYVHEWHLTTAANLIATKGISCFLRAPTAVPQYFRSCADCAAIFRSDSSHFGRGLWELYTIMIRIQDEMNLNLAIFLSFSANVNT